MHLVFIAALFWLSSASPDCEDYGECGACTSATSWTGSSCRWCPPISCHSWGSPLNTCSEDQQITEPQSCPAPTIPPGFEIINELMKGVYFSVANQIFTTSDNIKISIVDLSCGDVALLNLSLTPGPLPNHNIGVNVSMPGLTVRCTARWGYEMLDFPYLSGDGGVIALATASGQTNLEFFSHDFNKGPPTDSYITACVANVAVVDSTWQGGISATIAETFKSTVNAKIGTEVQAIACKSISSLGASLLQQAVSAVSLRMQPYMGPPDLIPGRGEEGLKEVPGPLVDYTTNARFQQLQGFASKFFNGEGSPATLSINGWIRDLLPKGRFQQVLNLELTNGTDSMLHTAFTISSLSVSGLDSLTVFEPLSIFAPHTFTSRLAWENIDIGLGFVLDLAPGSSSGGFNASRMKTERVQVHTSLKKLSLHVAWLLAVNQLTWSSLPLGGVLASPASCMLSSIPFLQPNNQTPWLGGYMANVSMLNVSLGEIGPASLAGFVSRDLATLFAELTNVGLELYERAALAVMPKFADSEGRAKLNDMIQEYISKPSHAQCPPPEVAEVVNFTENKLFTKVEGWVYEYMQPALVNKEIIDPFTTTQSGTPGTYALREMFISTRIGNGFFSLDRVFATGLDSVDNLTLLHPIAPRVLHSQLDMAGEKAKPLGAEVVMYMQVDEPQILNNVRMAVVIHDVTVKGDLVGRLNQTSLNAMPLGQVFQWPCWLAVLEGAELKDLGVSIGSVSFVADCDAPYSCSSPAFRQLATNLQNPVAAAKLGQLATRFLTLLADRLRPRLDANIENAGELCMQAMTNASTMMSALNEAATSAPVDEEAASQARFLETFIIISCVVGTLAFAACGFSIFRQYRRYKSRDSAFLSSRPLVLHPRVPVLVRVLVPLLLAANIVFMVSGHLSLGASVDIEMKLLGEDITIKEFYGFSLSGSLKDMYKAGAWGLLILVAGFSGVWPYAKILLMYWCWLAPPAILDEKARGKRLWFLDMAGKWSLIDMYVLIQSMVAFHISVSQPPATEPPILPVGFLYVNLHVAPVWGLYSFLFAVTLSLLLSHVCLYFHRKAFLEHDSAEPGLAPSLNGDGFSLNFSKESISSRMLAAEESHVMKESVSGWMYQVVWESESRSVRLRPVGRALGGLLLFLGLCLQVGASFVYAFEFDVQGLAGLAISWTQDPVTRVSLVDMAYYLCAQGATDTTTILGLGFISVLYLLASFVMPVLNLALLSLLWWIPLTVKAQKRCLYFLEIVCAWCALEVFLVSIIVALGEVGQISEFLVGSNCRSIDPFIKNTLIPLQFLPPGQTKCFEVQATLLSGMYLLVLTCLSSNILHFLVSHLAEHSLSDREFGHQRERTPASGCQKALQKALICLWYPFLVVYKNQDDEEDQDPKVSLQAFDVPELPSVRLPAGLGPKKPKYPSSSAMSSPANSVLDASSPLSSSLLVSHDEAENPKPKRSKRHESRKTEKYPTSKGKKDTSEREIR